MDTTVNELRPIDPPPPARRWTRRINHRWFAGVAGGIADEVGIPIWIVRVGFVITAALGSLGLWAYLLLWWVMPRRDLSESAAQRTARRFPQAPIWLGIGLLAVGILLFAAQLGWIDPPFLAALILIAIGVLLFVRDSEPEEVATVAGSPTTQPGTAAVGGTDLPPASLPPAVVPRVRRRPSFLGPLTLGLGLVAIGIGAVLDLGGVVSFTFAQASALLVFILGVGLAVGGFFGRARWLILPLVFLVPLAIVANVLRIDLDQGFGNRVVTVAASGGVSVARLGAGEMTVDLTALDAGASATVRAELGVGELTVQVPDDVQVEMTGNVGLGTTGEMQGHLTRQGFVTWHSGYGAEVGGFDRPVLWTPGPHEGEVGGRILISADVSIGAVRIIHVHLDRGGAR